MARNLESEQHQASAQIQALYKESLVKHLSGQKVHGDEITLPAPPWRSLAAHFPHFKGIIFKLGTAISSAEFDRDNTPNPETESLRSQYFAFTDGDKEGQYLMADLLRYRIREATEYVQIISNPQEAHRMLQEYGFENGLLTPTRHPIDLATVVDRVLEGAIKLTPQTFTKDQY